MRGLLDCPSVPWRLWSAGGAASWQEQAKETVKTFTYKKTKQADLAIHVHFPPDWKKEDKRPAILFFFGGGWETGTIKAFEPQADYLARRGLVAARADYRARIPTRRHAQRMRP